MLSRVSLCMAVLVSAAAAANAGVVCVNAPKVAGCSAHTSTIAAGVAAATPGDTVVVAPGTYAEDVHIAKAIALVALPTTHVVINAAGKTNGIFVDGLAATPNVGVQNVTVTGFEVENANYEGIVVVNAANVTLTANHVHNNNKKLTSPTCPGIAAWETQEGQDCGEGVHLVGVNHSNITNNLIENNSGGILMTDETGATYNNTISDNIVRDNGYACGITMASHPAANASGPITALNYGLAHNVISHNDSYHNGTLIPGSGAGVGIFAPGPGSSNVGEVVIGNELHDNGQPGVAMHNHANVPGAPPVFFNDNEIIGNHIYGNAADAADAATAGPTGINIYSLAPMTGTVIEKNVFDNESIDIAFKAPAGSSLITHFNNFDGNDIGVDNLGAGVVDGTENWWNCWGGPGTGCATAAGGNVSTLPYLLAPYSSQF